VPADDEGVRADGRTLKCAPKLRQLNLHHAQHHRTIWSSSGSALDVARGIARALVSAQANTIGVLTAGLDALGV
jgi:hypothetical protein